MGTNFTNFLGGPKMRMYPAALKVFERTVYFGEQGLAADDVHQVIPVLPNDVIFAVWAEIARAGNSKAVFDLGYGDNANCWGNKLLVDSVGRCVTLLSDTLIWDAYEIEDKSEHTNEIEIAGVRYGDHVTVAPGMDIADMVLTGDVIHQNWAAVTMSNNTGGTLDLASQSVHVVVNKAPQNGFPIMMTDSDTIDITAHDAINTGIMKVSALIFRG